MSSPGLIVVDTTFLRKLVRPELAPVIRTALRTANLEIWPSAANLLEAYAIPEPERRRRFIESINDWLGGRPLLPFPTDFLRDSGHGLKSRSNSITLDAGNADLLTSAAISDIAIHDRAKRLGASLGTVFDSVLADRRLYQSTLKRDGKRHAWQTIPDFLTSEWSGRDNMADLVAKLWHAAECVGDPPSLDHVLSFEPWRIAIEAFGASIYERTIRVQQRPNLPGIIDILQLVYLSYNPRCRIFITDDGTLHDVASDILVRRYQNVRVMTAAEFLGAAA